MQVRYRLTYRGVKRYTQGTMASISDWKSARIDDAGMPPKFETIPRRGARRREHTPASLGHVSVLTFGPV